MAVGLPSPQFSDEEAVDFVTGQVKPRPMITPDTSGPVSHQRKLGDSELSYYLPGRAAGVNDMCANHPFDGRSNKLTPLYDRYLHLGFKSPERIMVRRRVCAAWAILRMRHPLLASTVVMQDYDDVRFVYVPYRFRDAR
jgi:hypothetical protein